MLADRFNMSHMLQCGEEDDSTLVRDCANEWDLRSLDSSDIDVNARSILDTQIKVKRQHSRITMTSTIPTKSFLVQDTWAYVDYVCPWLGQISDFPSEISKISCLMKWIRPCYDNDYVVENRQERDDSWIKMFEPNASSF